MRMTVGSIAQTILPSSFYQQLAHSEIGRRFAKGTFWSLISSCIVKGATFVQAIFLARILGITNFGQWGILLSTIAMVQVFASFSLAVATIKYVALWKYTQAEKLGRLLGLLNIVAISISLPTCLVLIFHSQIIAANVLAAPQLAGPLALIGVIVLLSSLSDIYQGVLTGLERFRELAWISGGSTVAGVVLTVSLAFTHDLMGAISGLVLTNFLAAIACIWCCFKAFKDIGIKVRFSRCWQEWKGVWNYAIPSTLAGLVVTMSFWVAQVVLVQQPDGYQAMGAYHAANQWRTIIIFLPTQLMAAYLPVMTSLKTNPGKLGALQNRILISIILFTTAITVPVILLAPWLMQLYGRDFIGFSSTLAVMAMLPILDIGHLVLQQSAIVHGYMWAQLLANSTLIVVVAVGAYMFIPLYMALGLALALFFGYAVRLFAEWILFRYQIKHIMGN